MKLQLQQLLDICISHINRIRNTQLQSPRHVHVVNSKQADVLPLEYCNHAQAQTTRILRLRLIEGKIIHVQSKQAIPISIFIEMAQIL